MADHSFDASRFSIASSQDIDRVVSCSRSKNTVRNSSWCTKLYEDWATWRNQQSSTTQENDYLVPQLTDLWTAPKADISRALKHFIFEIRRQDGTEYPPNTIYNIVCGLARFIREERPDCNIMDKEDFNFVQFVRALDACMRNLTSRGIGSHHKRADPISEDSEAKLWDTNAFSLHDGNGLLRAVYFYNCKVFGLRACDKHRQMQLEQFTFSEDDHGKFVEYTGRGNKVFSGGIRDRKIQNKCVRQYDSDNNRSVYKILKLYVSRLRSMGVFTGAFYRRPLRNLRSTNYDA